MEGRPWAEYSRGKSLSPRGLARLLKDFSIVPGTIRLASGSTPKGYKRDAFVPHWERYGMGLPEAPIRSIRHNATTKSGSQFRAFPIRHKPARCGGYENTETRFQQDLWRCGG